LDSLIIAGGGGYQLYYSYDKGEHWSKGFRAFFPDSLPIRPGANILHFRNYFVAMISGGTYQSSTDLFHWMPFYIGPILSGFKELNLVSGVSLFAHDPSYVYPPVFELSDSFYVSINDGDSWKSRYFGNYGAVSIGHWCEDGEFIYAGGVNNDSMVCVFRSSDLGISWQQLNPIRSITNEFYYISGVYVVSDTIIVDVSMKGSYNFKYFVIVSTDAGKDWRTLLSWPRDSAYMEGPPSRFNDGKVYTTVYTSHGLDIASTPIDRTEWTIFNQDQPLDFTITNYEIIGNRILISIDDKNRNGSIYSSDNGGYSWEISDYGTDRNYPVFSTFLHDTTLFFTGRYSDILPKPEGFYRAYYSKDRGLTWRGISKEIPDAGNIFVGSKSIFLSGDNGIYRYPLSLIDSNISSSVINTLNFESIYPSPANYDSYIRFAIPESAKTILDVYDITGRKITTLASKSYDQGEYEVTWNTKTLPSGTYLLLLRSNGKVATRAMQIVH
jgi:hypothetical protein